MSCLETKRVCLVLIAPPKASQVSRWGKSVPVELRWISGGSFPRCICSFGAEGVTLEPRKWPDCQGWRGSGDGEAGSGMSGGARHPMVYFHVSEDMAQSRHLAIRPNKICCILPPHSACTAYLVQPGRKCRPTTPLKSCVHDVQKIK